jgi:hypothetical protein
MSKGDNGTDLQLERYLDGLVEGAERERLELRLQENQVLRAEIERQRRVDQSLARIFNAPSADAILARLEQQSDGHTSDSIRPGTRRLWRTLPRRPSRRQLISIAALIALTVLAIWRFWSLAAPPQQLGPYTDEWKSMAQIYDDVADFGFRNFKSSYTVDVFARLIERRFGQPLLLEEPFGPVQPLGIAYCNTISPKSMCIVTLVSTPCGAFGPAEEVETGVLVFIDRIDQDPARALPNTDRLNVFTRHVGQLALYEVTPLEQPAVLNLLSSRGDRP